MNYRKFLLCLIVLPAVLLGLGPYGVGLAQTPAPTAKSTPAAAPDLNLDLQRIGGRLVVQMQNLFEILHKLDPAATMGWDPGAGLMRIESGGKRIEILSRQPLISIDGRFRALQQSIIIRQGRVFVPVEAVQILLDKLGIEFDIKTDGQPAPAATTAPLPPAALSPTPAIVVETPPVLIQTPKVSDSKTTSSAPAPMAASPAPALNSAPTSATQNEAAPPVVITKLSEEEDAGRPQVAPEGGESAPLEPPAALAGKIGLTWGQLADLNHRAPPRRLSVVYDEDLADAAAKIKEDLQGSLPVEVTLIAAPSPQRSDSILLNRVQAAAPDLLVDLEAPRPPQGRSDVETITVWTAHDVLWPQDRDIKADASAPQLRYRRHQFQSLALGSLLRTELGRQWPERLIVFELAPSFLLRRVGAPSAAVLLPGARREAKENQRLGAAVAAALADYVKGMEKVKF